jgi:hypothetical protein
MAKKIVPKRDAKPIHGAVQTECDHQHHCRLCQLGICLFEVVYRASWTDVVDIFADDPKKKISASAARRRVGQVKNCLASGNTSNSATASSVPKGDAERYAAERKQSGYEWVQEDNA